MKEIIRNQYRSNEIERKKRTGWKSWQRNVRDLQGEIRRNRKISDVGKRRGGGTAAERVVERDIMVKTFAYKLGEQQGRM